MFYEPHVILVGSNWIFMGWCGAVSQWRPCLSLAVNMCKCTPSPRDMKGVVLLVFFQVLRKVRWRLSKFIQEWLTKVALSWWIVTIPAADVGIYRGTKALSVKLYIDITPLGPPKGSLAIESSQKMAFRLMRSWNSLRIVYYFSMHQIILLYLFNCEAYAKSCLLPFMSWLKRQTQALARILCNRFGLTRKHCTSKNCI